ncbi:hypothetical protein BDV97DRAFT_348547 [Delphinella strobiligena]|nr:hypothetical protein BDV97DRAFT_348547 [Delphinella strobiligena]
MTAHLENCDGSIVLLGELVDRLADINTSDLAETHPFQVTIFTAEEAKQLGEKLNGRMRKFTDVEPPISLGLGKQGDSHFRVLFWSQGNILRRQMMLPDKDFHILLDNTSAEIISQTGAGSIVDPASLGQEEIERIIQDCQAMTRSRKWRESCDQTALFLAQNYVSDLRHYIFDRLWSLLGHNGMGQASAKLALSYYTEFPNDFFAHLRMGDSLPRSRYAKRAMFHYAYAANHALKESSFGLPAPIIEGQNVSSLFNKCIMQCWNYTEFGRVFQEREIDQWDKHRQVFEQSNHVFEDPSTPEIRSMVQKAYSEYMNRGLLDIDKFLPDLLSVSSDERLFVPWGPIERELYKLPRFFRWLVPFRLAVMSTPRSAEDVVVLRERLLITTIITLTFEQPLPGAWFASGKSRNIFIPVKDYRSPSVEQVNRFIEVMSTSPSGEAALLHCGAGKGRTGTFAACYLMACGFEGHSSRRTFVDDSDELPLFPAEAIRLIRHMRPGSIESDEQEQFVRRYSSLILKPQTSQVLDAATPPEADIPLEILKGTPDSMRQSTLIVCCGLPGSGKSTFAAFLAAFLGFDVISQDELGTHGACVSALANAVHSRKKAVVDLRNPTPEKRQEWLDYAFLPRYTLCVWFDTYTEICIARANARPNHKTIAQGKARRAITSGAKGFIAPTADERFACVTRVRSTQDVTKLLESLGVSRQHATSPPPIEQSGPTPILGSTFISFPRTRHLYNFGAATKDDEIESDAASFLSTSEQDVVITLEEKIDGANMGIQVDPESPTGFKVQSRNRFLPPNPGDQLGLVNNWILTHEDALQKLLLGGSDDKKSPPGKYILFGEWLYAKHAIQYHSLPDMFIAFDLYDAEYDAFFSRKALSQRLEGSGICQVPTLPLPERLDGPSLQTLVREMPSAYSPSFAEGIYLRREKGDRLIDRAKIVRKDFMAGNNKWSRGERRGITLNIVDSV